MFAEVGNNNADCQNQRLFKVHHWNEYQHKEIDLYIALGDIKRETCCLLLTAKFTIIPRVILDIFITLVATAFGPNYNIRHQNYAHYNP